MNDNNYLVHHGVKGMKWGVRKTKDTSFRQDYNGLDKYEAYEQAYGTKYGTKLGVNATVPMNVAMTVGALYLAKKHNLSKLSIAAIGGLGAYYDGRAIVRTIIGNKEKKNMRWKYKNNREYAREIDKLVPSKKYKYLDS